MTRRAWIGLLVLVAAGLGFSPALSAESENPPVSRSVMLQTEIHGGEEVRHVTMQRIRMAPQVQAPVHSHPCPTFGLVLEGEITFQLEGFEPQVLRPGDAFYEPASVRVRRFDNTGDSPAVFVVNYLLPSADAPAITMDK